MHHTSDPESSQPQSQETEPATSPQDSNPWSPDFWNDIDHHFNLDPFLSLTQPTIPSSSTISYAPPPGPPPLSARSVGSFGHTPLHSEPTMTFAHTHTQPTNTTLHSTPSSLSIALDSPGGTPSIHHSPYNHTSPMPPPEHARMPQQDVSFGSYPMPSHRNSQPTPQSRHTELFGAGATAVFNSPDSLASHAPTLYHQLQHPFPPYNHISYSPTVATDSTVSSPAIATPPVDDIPLPFRPPSSSTVRSHVYHHSPEEPPPPSPQSDYGTSTPPQDKHPTPRLHLAQTPQPTSSDAQSRSEQRPSQVNRILSSNLPASSE